MRWIEQQKAKERSERRGDYEACDLLDIGYLVDSVVMVSLVCRTIGRIVFIGKV
jgi:hypothetical protein